MHPRKVTDLKNDSAFPQQLDGEKKPSEDNPMQQTLVSTEKATYLQSKLVNPEMFYVTENNCYKKDNKQRQHDSSDIDNDFERDSQ